jgi:aminoglycoside 6-adenylyltransferase
MLGLPDEANVLARLVRWAEREDAVRTLVLTSSRARADETVDALSDYDVIIGVGHMEEFLADESWVRGYGEPLARWGDRDEVLGLATTFCGVVYTDRIKIDYSVWPQALVERVAEAARLLDDLDVGYRVLVDKDGATSGWRAATHGAHVPDKPTRVAYEALVEEFWWDTTYVAKGLWRGELFFAKWVLDCSAKSGAVRRMLEWRIELDHGWSLRPGSYGRGLERLLPAEVWVELAATYGGVRREECWEALFRTTALFRRVATEVGDALGYPHPVAVDAGVTAFLADVRALGHGPPST